MAKPALSKRNNLPTIASTGGGKNPVIKLRGKVSKVYASVIEDRIWLRDKMKSRIQILEKLQQEMKDVVCDKCSIHVYRDAIEDNLLRYISDMKNILDSISKFDHKHDIEKLLENVILEIVRSSFESFFDFVPDESKEEVANRYKEKVKTKTEDLIRRSLL